MSDFGTGLEVILVLKRLDFSSTLSRLLCVQLCSQLDQLIETLGPDICVRYRDSIRVRNPGILVFVSVSGTAFVQDLNLKIEN